MRLKLITDSACDLPEELLKKYDIDFLSFPIFIDGQEYRDGRTVTANDVFAAIRAGLVPTSAQVPVEDFLATFTKYAQEKRPCLYMSVSGQTTGSLNTARLVAQAVQEEYPGFQIEVVDTLSGSLAQGLIVLEAAQMLEAGTSSEEVIERVKARAGNVEHLFTVDDLKYLNRGGRLNATTAFLGGMLNLKPVLYVEDGAIIPYQKVRGKKMAIRRLVDLVAERSLGDPDQLIAVAHADDPEAAEELEGLLREKLGYKNFLTKVIGSVLGCHIGVGAVGVFCVNKNLPIPNLPE